MISIEYIKTCEEEERYRIYHRGKLMWAVIVVSHIARNITFDTFIDEEDEEIAPEIFRIAEEYIIPEYEGYKVWRNNVIGNILYWKWKEDNNI